MAPKLRLTLFKSITNIIGVILVSLCNPVSLLTSATAQSLHQNHQIHQIQNIKAYNQTDEDFEESLQKFTDAAMGDNKATQLSTDAMVKENLALSQLVEEIGKDHETIRGMTTDIHDLKAKINNHSENLGADASSDVLREHIGMLKNMTIAQDKKIGSMQVHLANKDWLIAHYNRQKDWLNHYIRVKSEEIAKMKDHLIHVNRNAITLHHLVKKERNVITNCYVPNFCAWATGDAKTKCDNCAAQRKSFSLASLNDLNKSENQNSESSLSSESDSESLLDGSAEFQSLLDGSFGSYSQFLKSSESQNPNQNDDSIESIQKLEKEIQDLMSQRDSNSIKAEEKQKLIMSEDMLSMSNKVKLEKEKEEMDKEIEKINKEIDEKQEKVSELGTKEIFPVGSNSDSKTMLNSESLSDSDSESDKLSSSSESEETVESELSDSTNSADPDAIMRSEESSQGNASGEEFVEKNNLKKNSKQVPLEIGHDGSVAKLLLREEVQNQEKQKQQNLKNLKQISSESQTVHSESESSGSGIESDSSEIGSRGGGGSGSSRHNSEVIQ